MKTNDFDDESVSSFDSEEIEDGSGFSGVPTPSGLKDDDELNIDFDEDSEDDSNAIDGIVQERKSNSSVQDNDALKMINTFNTIQMSVIELAGLSNTVIKEVDKLLLVSEQKNEDIKDVSSEYINTYNKVKSLFKKLQDYTDLNEGFIDSVKKLENTTSSNYSNFNDELSVIAENHKYTIESNTEKIINTIDSIGKNIDTKPILKAIEKKLSEDLDKSSLKKIEGQFEKISIIYDGIVKNVDILAGSDSKKGLFYDLNDEIEDFSSKINGLKKGINWIGFGFSLVIGVCIGWYSYMITNEDRKSNLLIDFSLEQQQKFNEKFMELKNSHKGYESFLKKHGLKSKDVGFGHFENSGKPYFFYEKDKYKIYLINNKYYVELR